MDFYFLLYCHVSTSDCNINSTTAVVVVVILKQISFCVSVACWWCRGEDTDIRLQWSTIMKQRTNKSVRSISAPIFLIPSAVILIVCRIVVEDLIAGDGSVWGGEGEENVSTCLIIIIIIIILWSWCDDDQEVVWRSDASPSSRMLCSSSSVSASCHPQIQQL